MHSGSLEESSIQEAAEPGTVGALVVKLPLPPGFMTGLYHNDERFVQAYMTEYPGFYNTGDIGYIDKDGYVYVTSRAEDEIKISGHRISTGSLEEVGLYELSLKCMLYRFLFLSIFLLLLNCFMCVCMCCAGHFSTS